MGELQWNGSDLHTGMSFTTTQKSEINTEVNDVLKVDTNSELSAVPASTASTADMIQFLYMWLRNNTTSTSSTRSVRNNAGTIIGTATMSDDGSTFSQGKMS